MEYAQYKLLDSSGISWLQKKPIHWRIKRLKFSTELINNKVNVEESHLPYLGLEHIESWTGRKIDGEINNSEGLASSFLAGDVLFGKLRPYLAKVHLAQQDGLISSEALVLRSKNELRAEFLKYYMLSRDFINIVDSSTYGSKMPRASWDFIGNLPVLLPEVEEQQTIARFLDFKTAQIDALVAKKQALLEKLAEKRTALIGHAVTKGLDPSVPMKDSGVAWLGEIPAHWQSKKIKYFTLILRGKFSHRPRNDPRFYDGDYPFIQTGDVANVNKFITNYSQTLNEEGLKVSREFPAGTLVMTIAANIGDMAILNFDACFPDSIVGFVPHESVELNYLFYLFTAMRQQLLSTAVLNTQFNLNIERIADQFGACPPITEQIKISKYLDIIVSNIATQQASIARVVEKLQEYRSALITNAVTGKIDLRNWQAPKETA